jgi:hypothetical protein
MRVPLGGFGKTLGAMYDWHQARGIRAVLSTGCRDENNRDYIRWFLPTLRWPICSRKSSSDSQRVRM